MSSDNQVVLERVNIGVLDIADFLAAEVAEHDQNLLRIWCDRPAFVEMAAFFAESVDFGLLIKKLARAGRSGREGRHALGGQIR